MRATESHGSFLNRISIRRNQVVSMDGNHEQELDDLDIFQKHVAERFSNLLQESSSNDPNKESSSLLSIAFLRKLLDAFLCCEAEFKALLVVAREPAAVARPPLDRLLPELLDRSVRALDVCNAVTHGVEAVRRCQKLAEIAAAAIGDGQVRRARKALSSLAAAMAVDEDYGGGSSAGVKSTERAWSFGRSGRSGGSKVRSSSAWWGMGKAWSAAKQIQYMSANLAPPRGTAAEASGLAQAVYVMSSVTVFVMWALAAAIPCQDRSGLGHVAARQPAWGQAVAAMHERVAEEWRRKERRGSAGLLDELQTVERAAAAALAEPVEEAERAEEAAEEMAEACRRMEEGLLPLQHQIREVFHKLVKTRADLLHVLDQGSKLYTPAT